MDEAEMLRIQVTALQNELKAETNRCKEALSVCHSLESERNALLLALRVQQEEFFKLLTPTRG